VAMVGGSYFDPWESIWWELILGGGPPGVWNPECHKAYMSTRVAYVLYFRAIKKGGEKLLV
jgi:hypothetical protein